MLFKLAFLFIVVPILEITLLLKVGELIDFWPTVGIILATGFFGAWLAKMQGRLVLGRIRGDLSSGRIPKDALVDGLLVIIAGVVLVTHGLLTDATGLLLLVPPVRAMVRKRLKAYFQKRLTEGAKGVFLGGGGLGGGGGFGPGGFGPGGFGGPPERRPDPIQGEIIDVDPED